MHTVCYLGLETGIVCLDTSCGDHIASSCHFLSRGLGVVWVDDGDGAGPFLAPPPPMSLLRCVSQLMHLKGLPTAAYMGAVCGLRETSLVYFCSSAPFYAGDVRCLARNRQSPTACLHRYSVNYAFFLITFPVLATVHDSFVGLPKGKRPPPTSAYCFELA